MDGKPGIRIVDAEDFERIAREVAAAPDLATFTLSTKGKLDRKGLFDAVRQSFPLDPPLVGSHSWDALSDSLWEGLWALVENSIVLLWRDSSDFRNASPSEFLLALAVLKDVADSLAGSIATGGRPKRVYVYVVRPPNFNDSDLRDYVTEAAPDK